jgi:hypothetical protein
MGLYPLVLMMLFFYFSVVGGRPAALVKALATSMNATPVTVAAALFDLDIECVVVKRVS